MQQQERHEIPKAEWPAALDQFSRAHRGQEAVVAFGEGAAPKGSVMPLIGVTSERTASGDERIEIIAGQAGGGHYSHTIARPARVWLREWNDGVSGLLEIEAQDGTKVSVQAGPAEQ